MRSFIQYITEAKNTHLEHLEDELWNDGSAGAENALRFASEVASMLSGNTKTSVNITTKWDGAPAIFAGINPENKKFFVGTKSVFNVTNPKINYTERDINKNHSGGLATKLEIALKYLPKLKIKGVLQGDMMFSSGDLSTMKINNEDHIAFTPNTITYTIPVDSKLAREVKQAKIGVVFHTNYTGRKMSNMKASFNPNIRSLKKNKSVWFRDADFKDESGSSTLTSSEYESIEKDIKNARSSLSKSSKFIDKLLGNSAIISYVKTYINSIVKAGSVEGNTKGLISHIKDKLNGEIDKLKTDSAKKRKEQVRDKTVKYLEDNKSTLDKVFKLHSELNSIKIALVRKLEKIKGIGTFMRTNNGFRATSPEGFVAVDRISNKALKLVDRLEFSRSNFTAAKNWVKG